MKTNPEVSTFVDQLLSRPEFSYCTEVESLARSHSDGISLLHALIEHHYLAKDEACRAYADSLGFPYLDPLGTILTDEAVAALPDVIARKACAIGLYIIDGVLTVALAHPEDETLVHRLAGVAGMPVSPVFALPRDIDQAIIIQYSNEKSLAESLDEPARSALFEDPHQVEEKLAAVADSSSVAANQ